MRVDIFTTAGQVTRTLFEQVLSCWIDVANAGGAVGFPFPPVGREDVEPVLRELVAGLDERSVLVAAFDGEALVGWLTVHRGAGRLTAHWAELKRVQTRPDRRGEGAARLLLEAAEEWGRGLGLDHLWLAARGGVGLEAFYERLGWREAGRHLRALRMAEGDDRDEVFFRKPVL